MSERAAAASPWVDFLQDYQHSKWKPNITPRKPQSSPDADETMSTSSGDGSEELLYDQIEITPRIASKVARFVDAKGYLAAPRSEWEPERIMLSKEYNFSAPEQHDSMTRIARLTQMIFGGTVIASFFDHSHQIIHAAYGDLDLPIGPAVDKETGICAHALLRRDQQPLVVADCALDWRFKRNPYCASTADRAFNITGYVGQPILLPISSPADQARPARTIPVGVLAIITVDGKQMIVPSPNQIQILQGLADSLATEVIKNKIELQRKSEELARQSIQTYLLDALVQRLPNARDSRPESPSGTAALDTPLALQKSMSASSQAESSYGEACNLMMQLTKSDMAVVIDISSIYRSKDDSFSSMYRVESKHPHKRLKTHSGFRVIASQHNANVDIDLNLFESEQALSLVIKFLQQCTASDDLTQCPPLDSGMREMFKGVTSLLATPHFSATQPHLLLLVASTDPKVEYGHTERDWLMNLGAIIQARITRDRLQEADNAKTTFISQITHELRTPLHGLLAQIEVMRDCLGTLRPEEMADMLNAAESCGQALSDILNDVLDFGKMSMNSMDVLRSAASAKRQEVVQDVLQLLISTARASLERSTKQEGQDAKDVSFQVEADDRPEHVWQAWIDVAGFQRILFNILTNAFKYTERGSIVLSLKLITDDVGRTLMQILCNDTGRGMKQAFLNFLFEPFTQADNFSSGAGLGLFIVKAILARMGGSISVDSEYGKGSNFSILLPFNPANSEVLPLGACPSKTHRITSAGPTAQVLPSATLTVSTNSTNCSTEPAKWHPDLRVLAIDDNKLNLQILTQILKRAGVPYQTAQDGEEAVQKFREFQPQLVWTDISMPKLDGIEAAREIRSIENDLKLRPAYIIALTGLGSSNEQAVREGMLGQSSLNEWLVKGQSKMDSLKKSLREASDRLYAHDRNEIMEC